MTNIKTESEEQVTAIVERFRKSVLDADRSALNALLADELSYGHSDGHVEGKSDLISKLCNGTYMFVTMDLSSLFVQTTGDLAIARHQLDAVTNDGGLPGEAHLLVLLVWQKADGDWKLVARQAVKQPLVS